MSPQTTDWGALAARLRVSAERVDLAQIQRHSMSPLGGMMAEGEARHAMEVLDGLDAALLNAVPTPSAPGRKFSPLASRAAVQVTLFSVGFLALFCAFLLPLAASVGAWAITPVVGADYASLGSLAVSLAGALWLLVLFTRGIFLNTVACRWLENVAYASFARREQNKSEGQ